MPKVDVLSNDDMECLCFIESGLQCVASPTIGNAGRLGICLDLVANLRAFMEDSLLAPLEAKIAEHGEGDNAAWQAVDRLRKLIECLPEAEVEWIDADVGALKVYDG